MKPLSIYLYYFMNNHVYNCILKVYNDHRLHFFVVFLSKGVESLYFREIVATEMQRRR